MKRVLCLCLFLLSACADSKPSIQTIRLAVSVYNQSDTFIDSVAQYIKKYTDNYAEEHSVIVQVDIYDASGSQTTQNKQMDQFMEKGYDGVAINMVDRTASASIIEKAKEKGIPLVFFNREPVDSDMQLYDKLYYVGCNSVQIGYDQGNMIYQAYEDNPASIDINNDNIIQYVLIEGEPGHQDATIRSQYCIQPFIDNEVKIEEVDFATANWSRSQGQEQMRNFFNHDNHIEVVFCNNDEMAIGAIKTMEEYNRYIPIVGVDGISDALKEIEKGTLYGTVLNDDKKQGEMIAELLICSINNESVDEILGGNYRKLLLDGDCIMKDNVKNYLKN